MVATQFFFKITPILWGRCFTHFDVRIFFKPGLVKNHQPVVWCLAAFSWKVLENDRDVFGLVSIPNHPNHSIDSWRPVSRPIIARFSSCWKQRPGNFMGIYKHLEGQVKWRFPGFSFFFLMDGDSLGVVHWELFRMEQKGGRFEEN